MISSLADIGSLLLQIAKWCTIVLALLNCRSWPLIWSVRVFLPVAKFFISSWVFDLKLLFHSRRRREVMRRERKSRISRVGKNPLAVTTYYRSWASFDDCDYNLHLSNSTYPKILDMARMKAALEHFPAYLRTGGFLVLGGTHFDFIREIPILSQYEARVSIASWDDRWLYLVGRFVTRPKSKGSFTASRSAQIPSVPLIPLKEHDGAIVHCVSINLFIFKQGRITIPPALALACDGYSNLSHDNQPHNLGDPPPHWSRVMAIKAGGSKAMRKYMQSWKSVPPNERWWEDVFAGPVEDQRVTNLALIQGVLAGMQGARSIIATD